MLSADNEGEKDLVRTVNELRDMAAQCRDLATLAKTEEVREQLLEVADQFERAAQDRLFFIRRDFGVSGTVG